MLKKSKSSIKIICSILAVVFIVSSLGISAFATIITEYKNVSSTVYYNITCPDYVANNSINSIVSSAPATKDYSEGAGGFSGTLNYSNYYISSSSPLGYPYPNYLYTYTIAVVYTGKVSRTVNYPDSKVITSVDTHTITCYESQIQSYLNSLNNSNPTKSYSEPHYSATLPLVNSVIVNKTPIDYPTSNVFNYIIIMVYSATVNFQP